MISPEKARIEYSISAKNELSQLDAHFSVRLRWAFLLSLVLNALVLSAFSVLPRSRTDAGSSTQPIEITRLVLDAPIRGNVTNARPKTESFSPRAESATTQLKADLQSSRAESRTSFLRQPTRFQRRYDARENHSHRDDEKRSSLSTQHKIPTSPVAPPSNQRIALKQKVARRKTASLSVSISSISKSSASMTTEKSGVNERFGAVSKTTSHSSATNRSSQTSLGNEGNSARSSGSSSTRGSTRQADATLRFAPANTPAPTPFFTPLPQPTSTPITVPTPKPTAFPTLRPTPIFRVTPEPTPEKAREPTPREMTPQPTPRKPRGETRKARTTRQFEPTIPENMRDEEFKKSVRVRVEVRADGSFDVSLRGSSGSGRIDALTLETLRRWRWKPALQEGEPVESVQNFRVDFNVESLRV